MKFNIELDDRSLNVIANALGARPYVEVAPLLAELDAQVKKQQQAAHDAAADRRDEPAGAPAQVN